MILEMLNDMKTYDKEQIVETGIYVMVLPSLHDILTMILNLFIYMKKLK